MATTTQTFEREIVELPPEDYAFLSGMVQALTAMYCRLHPIAAATTIETKKEDEPT